MTDSLEAPRQPHRCPWAANEPNLCYHDQEWGVPVHDDQRLFEFLILEGAQAGLSWTTILNKRAAYREAFDDFVPAKVALYGADKEAALLRNEGIVRNRLKIASAIRNAGAFLEVQREFGSFDSYVWGFMEGRRPRQNHFRLPEEIPTRTVISDTLSRDLKKRGFNFVGTTICYAFMQAVGMVNDHLVSCPRHKELGG